MEEHTHKDSDVGYKSVCLCLSVCANVRVCFLCESVRVWLSLSVSSLSACACVFVCVCVCVCFSLSRCLLVLCERHWDITHIHTKRHIERGCVRMFNFALCVSARVSLILCLFTVCKCVCVCVPVCVCACVSVSLRISAS